MIREPEVVHHRLAFTPPFDSAAFAGFLRAHAVQGVDALAGRTYSRNLRTAHGPTPLEIDLPEPDGGEVVVRLGGDPAGHPEALERVRRFLDLDQDPAEVRAALGDDPLVGPLVRARPGLRVPGAFDPFETAVFAILGQQVSLAAARTLDARFHAALSPDGVRFPEPRAVSALDPGELAGILRVPGMRARAIVGAAEVFAGTGGYAGAGDEGTDGAAERSAPLRAQLLAVPGIGPWTVDYLMFRCTADADAYVPGDLVLRKALAARTGAESTVSARTAQALAEPWRPHRARALMHLWTAAAYDAR